MEVLDGALAPSDADRRRASEALAAAVGQGVITLEEFERLLEAVYQARSVGELQMLTSSPPRATPARKSPRVWLVVGATLGALGLVLGLVFGLSLSEDHAPIKSTSSPTGMANALPSGPPATEIPGICVKSVEYEQTQPAYLNQRFTFALPPDPSQCAHVAGVGLGPRLAAAAYNHVHLDLVLAGGTVPVPAGIGVARSKQEYAPLFTESDTGIIWFTSGSRLTLGQFFQTWGHPLGDDIIGSLHTLPDYPVTWYINGRLVEDPASAVLHNRDEIFAFEDLRGASANPTKTFDWPSGY